MGRSGFLQNRFLGGLLSEESELYPDCLLGSNLRSGVNSMKGLQACIFEEFTVSD